MVDIVKAFRKFLLTCHRPYRQEAVYSTARQLLWNMTQSRPCFCRTSSACLHVFEADFRLKPYLKEDRETAKLLGYLDTSVCLTCSSAPTAAGSCPGAAGGHRPPLPLAEVLEPGGELAGKGGGAGASAPGGGAGAAAVCGGVPLLAGPVGAGRHRPGAGGPAPAALKEPPHGALLLRLRRWGEPFTLCFGALRGTMWCGHCWIPTGRDHIYNRAFLPLAERLRDFLITRFGFQMNGPPPNPGGRHRPPAQRAVLRLPTTGRTAAREPPRPRGL